MAHVVLGTRGNRREWFVIDRPVGQGLPNMPEDVLLVQFFLRVASETARGYAGFVPPGEPPLVIDGKYGPHTQQYILFYQNEVNRRMNMKQLQPDGRIDPILPGQMLSGLTQTVYTIIDLNFAYRSRRGDAARIEVDPLFPQALRARFCI